MQGLDDVLARLHLLIRRHGVLEIKNTTSAAERAAFSKNCGELPGTASSERCRRGAALLNDREAHGNSSSGSPPVTWEFLARMSRAARHGTPLGQRVMLAHGGGQPLALNMGVDLGGRNVGMAEHQLHRAQIGAGEQVAEGMAQDVGRDALGVEAGLGRQLAQQLREALPGEVALAGARGTERGCRGPVARIRPRTAR